MAKHKSKPLIWGLLLAAVGLTACATGESNTIVPTLTLIPPTATFTPAPITPTATTEVLPGPAEISGATATSDAPPQVPNGQTSTTLETDPVAAELVALAQRRLAQELDLPTRRIQIVDVRPFTWPDTSMGCPEPDQTYTPAQIDGYRIVLLAGDNEYIFHTDFDRVLPCEPANERLPETPTS